MRWFEGEVSVRACVRLMTFSFLCFFSLCARLRDWEHSFLFYVA